ncbi:MAG: DUF4410 domain-containing protein [Verrucomicrobiota bacterium]|nr:DUF4410 domain-containing protein [Verrucomicrobiota bacterium]
MKFSSLLFITFLASIPSFVFALAKITDEETTAALPSKKPDIIYVDGFSLDSSQAPLGQPQTGLFGRPRILANRMEEKHNPAEKAQEITSGMQQSIIKSLTNDGQTAQPDEMMPSSPKNAWLLKGEFIEVDQGSRIVRAVIGFGAGKAQMETRVMLYDLNRSADQPFVIMGSHAQTTPTPGAILMKNPYVLIAKFVLSKNADKKEIKRTGAQIAEAVEKIINKIGPPANTNGASN